MKALLSLALAVAVALAVLTSTGLGKPVARQLSAWLADFAGEKAAHDADDDDDDDDDIESRYVDYEQGRAVIVLPPGVIASMRLQTQALVEEAVVLEERSHAEVLPLDELVAARLQFRQATAAANTAGSGRPELTSKVESLRRLQAEGLSVSATEVQDAEQGLKRLDGEVAEHRRRARDLASAMRHRWGEELAEIALANSDPRFARLLQRKDVLLRVTLRPGSALDPTTQFIYVDANASRGDARRAYFIGPDLVTDPALQGPTYLFRTNASGLRAGMRMIGWVPRPDRARVGAKLSTGAIVWRQGQPWVYRETSPGRFIRTAVDGLEAMADGHFGELEFTPGDRVVTQGALELLSEEFRVNIPDEDEAG